jgi:hypothetical protein
MARLRLRREDVGEGHREDGAFAISGNLANQQILQAEGVDVVPGPNELDCHFRLTGTKTERLAASLEQVSSHPNETRQ